MAIYLGSSLLRTSSDLTRPVFPPPGAEGNSNGLFFPLRERGLFGLAPGGVYLAAPIAQGTGELLPHLFTLTPTFALYTMRCRAFVGAVRFLWHFPCLETLRSGFRNSPRYGPPCPAELGLSSPPDCPALRGLGRSDHLFPVNSPPFLSNLPPNRPIRQTISCLSYIPHGCATHPKRPVGRRLPGPVRAGWAGASLSGSVDFILHFDLPPNRGYDCNGDTEQGHCFFEPR